MAKQIIVQPGETLSGIAQRELGSALRWKELGEQIGITTEEQAKLLQPGATLTIPTEEIKEPFAPPITPERKTLEEKIGKVETELKEKKELLEKAKAYPYLKPKEEIPDWILEAESPEEVATLAKPARIKELEQLAFAAPPKTWEEIFTEAYDTSGLKNIKTRIKKFDDKITKIKDDLVSAEGKINENPWLTETGRVGRVKRLYDMAQKEINNLVEQRKSLVEEYKTGVSSAEKVAEKALGEWEKQTKLYKTELDYLTKTGKGEEYLSVAEAKALGLPYGTKKAEAMEKGIVPAKTAKSWIEFSDTEKRKLTAAGIDWTTSEGFSQALQYLYPLKVTKKEAWDWATKLINLNPNASYEELKLELISNPNTEGLTDSEIKSLLGIVGKKEGKEDEKRLLHWYIGKYKKDWRKEGDEEAGTREDLAISLMKEFKTFSYDEIMAEIYKQVTDEWLKANKKEGKANKKEGWFK